MPGGSGLPGPTGYQGLQTSETIFQVYEIPLERLAAADPDFDAGQIMQLIFLADPDPQGAGPVWLDEFGFRTVP